MSAGLTEWPMWGGDVKTFEFQYRVGADCARGTDLSTTVHFDGTVFVDDTTNGRGPSINVQKNVSATTLSPADAVKGGQSVELKAAVTGGADGDSVEFFDGATRIGEGTLANGAATLAWTPADVRTHSVTAKYLGNAKVSTSTSTSSAVDVVVSEDDKSTATTITGPASAVAVYSGFGVYQASTSAPHALTVAPVVVH
ncbi:Ig-like domain-containing protein [Rhodococcus sp. NPDC056506]|uniref:Ig-like domain-containing protein n=1 Tax=Rhodococcus sp. NPDC056506 TaxID=3345844 RepID=UPI003670FE20